jgi:hypothetical protein
MLLGNAASADNGVAAYPFPLEKSPRLSGDEGRGLSRLSGLFGSSGWVAGPANKTNQKDQMNKMNKSDERDWRDADLVVLVYLVGEKQGDLESAFFGLAC